jgi:lysozyme
MLIGFDVSRYEVVTNWDAVKAAGYAFGSTRATVGDYYTDPTFDSYWHGMKTAGILRMAYHVLAPDRPQNQINRFIDLVRTDWGELPPVLDLELDREVDRKVITDKTLYCLHELEKACGRKPIIYTTASFVTSHLLPKVTLGDYPLWVANYTTKPAPLLPASWTNWVFWQYTEAGKIPGINGATDLNWFNGDQDALNAMAGIKPAPPVSLEEWARQIDAWARARGYSGPKLA